MIDLSKLPPPDFVEVPSADAIREEMLDFLATHPLAGPTMATLAPGDPAYHVVELAAYRETILRQKLNDGVRALLLATSWGANLDHLGEPEGVERIETVLETGEIEAELDEPYRQRVVEAKQARGAGVREVYESAGKAADARLSDVNAVSPSPAVVSVEWVPKLGTLSGDYAAINAAVVAAIDEARMLTDSVSVVQATAVSYNVTGTLHIEPGPDPATVLAAATAALNAYDLAERRSRHPRPLSALHAVLKVSGVAKVVLTAPLADVEPVGAQYLELGTVTLSTVVASWLD